jgi:PAS domain S-box-containing protein
MLTTSITLLVACAAFVANDLIGLRQAMKRDLSMLGDILVTDDTAALTFNDPDAAEEDLNALSANPHIISACYYTKDGELFTKYVRADQTGDFSLPAIKPDGTYWEKDRLVVFHRVVLDDETIGTLYIESDLQEMSGRLRRYLWIVAVIMLASLGAAYLLSSGLQRVVSGPISHLARTVRAVSVEKDYTIRAVRTSRDEMGLLIDGFNEMLSQIQERDARLQTARDELELRVEERTKELQDEIAERERIEQVLRRSEEHFRSLIENASDVITIIDSNGTILYESPSVERVLGLKPQTLIGANALSLTHPDDRKSSVALLTAAIAEDAPAGPFELRFEHADGSWRTLEVVGQVVRDESGAVEVIINSRDITDRKRAAEKLQESETLFRSLAETVSAAIYIYRGSKFIYVNPAAETITGYTHDELMEMQVWAILHPDFLRETKERAALREKGDDVPTHSETKILTKSGEARWLDLTPSLIRFQGQQAVLATAFDITERKGWEETLRESEEKYRTILENIQEGYYEVDLTGNLTFFNDSLCRIVGSPRERLEGLNNREYTDPGTARKLYAAFNQVYRSGEPLEEYQYEIVTRDGVQKFVETSILLRRDQTGQISGFRGTLRDITERKRSEEALKASEAELRALFEAITDVIIVFDAEGRYRKIVPTNSASLYKPPDDLIGKTQHELFPKDKADFLVDCIRRALQEGRAQRVEYSLPLGETEVWFDGTVSPLSEDSVIWIARDITARKQAEKEVAMLAHAVRSIHESVVITDSEDKLLFVNDGFLKTYGYDRDEVLGNNVLQLVRPAKDSFSSNGSDSHQKIPSRWEGDLINRRKDGAEFPIHLSASPILDEAGRTIAYAAVIQDISERKRIEQEVTMLAHAIRTINESVVVTDLFGRIIFANEGAAKVFGYECAELLGQNVSIFDPQTQIATHADDVVASANTGIWEGEFLSRRKDGTEFPLHLSSSTINDEFGRPIALVGISQDVTDRRRRMEELEHAKEAAEAANRSKSEFLANMSHEIRTPMNGIIGMTELALDTELTGEQREFLNMVKVSADSLLGVINDVLDFSKIEAGKLELDPAEFNLVDAVDEVMKALAVRADQKGLELAYYLRPGVPERVVGDVGRLRQILLNLVGNAIKFTQHGEVIVRVEAETQTNEEVVLHFGVRDTGIGVPPEKQTVIFESFTQADGSTTRKYGGTGLGLSISSQLVQMMGGEIWVESPVTIPSSNGTPGSRFHFTGAFGLPVDSVSTAQPPEIFELADLPVLVVDDNATNRRILEVQLTSWHMKPAMVDGARSALHAIKQAAGAGAPFKLALLDFHMPEMDGLALCEEIKKLPEGRDLRIIMMSSSVQENHAGPRDRSINASLLKPVKAAELLSVIRVVLGADARSQTQQRPAGRKSAYRSRVLVAEDSTINQELIRRLLEKWGHTALIAENGLKALSLFENESFDLVLMDLQMPEMNGFEVTAAIRQQEQGTGTRVPIIALTAHALKGDRERCIAAGMDDYVSKPVDAGKLFDAVEAAAGQRGSAFSKCEVVPKALDLDGLMRNFDGDAELVLTLARVFGDSSLDQMEQISDAIAHGDAEALARGAHLLKGAVANFGARAAVDAAVRLEGIAKSGDLSLAGSALAALEQEIDRVKQELGMLEQASLV